MEYKADYFSSFQIYLFAFIINYKFATFIFFFQDLSSEQSKNICLLVYFQQLKQPKLALCAYYVTLTAFIGLMPT